ncbi:MAG: sugar ABC transporter permease [Firmicutes bacterium]|nr:sugar ABC transporter permease [Bacillota bacterium]
MPSRPMQTSLSMPYKRRLAERGRLGRLLADIKKNKVSYLFLAPYGIIFLIFTVFPVLISIGFSFTYYNILEPPQWIGWRNYINLFLADEVFLISIKNTFLLAAITGSLGYFASFFFAWLINELPRRIRPLFVLVFYAPALAGYAVSQIWGILFSGDAYGWMNGFLMKLGIIREPIYWLTDPNYMLPVLLVVVLWMSLSHGFLAFVAGLQTVDRSLYEAGYTDGIRNRWQELWYITLPSMRPQLMFGAVMSITQSFAIHDVLVPLVGFPSTDYAAHTVVSHLVDYGSFRFEMGYASAIATILFLVMVGTNKIVQRLLRKVGQ